MFCRKVVVMCLFVLLAVTAASACGDQFATKQTMCGKFTCYVLECQGGAYQICGDGTGSTKTCTGGCMVLQAGACVPPKAETQGRQTSFVDPADSFYNLPTVGGCALRGKALEDWIAKNRARLTTALQRSTLRRL